MSEETKEEKDEQSADLVAKACAIAVGEEQSDPDAVGKQVCAAYKDLNAKGRGPWWYRMVWRNGAWTYFSDERLPMGTFLASDRRASVMGDLFLGELVCQHDKGGPIDVAYLVVMEDGDSAHGKLQICPFRKRRDGQLVITLPDGREVTRPNPRSR